LVQPFSMLLQLPKIFATAALASPLCALATPTLSYAHGPIAPRPLVVWHGLGDSHSSPAMLEFIDLIKDVHPGIFVHSVYIEQNLDSDQKAGFYGNLHDQLKLVSKQLAALDELQGGFDAIGFSQGGQFLRAYVEQYNNPPANNLITFGSQHMGIADLPLCKPGDFLCQIARNAARSGVYNSWAQQHLIQTQYFRDPDRLPAYYQHNTFLTAINNELPDSRNQTYYDNLASLSNLVLVLFSADKTVVPKESSWFGSFAPPAEDSAKRRNLQIGQPCDGDESTAANAPWDEPKEIIPMRAHPIYTEDWIGLRTLEDDGRLFLETCEGEHMQLSDDCWRPLVKRFVGGLTLRDSATPPLRIQ